ncbi:MAG: hypothetical protein JST50_21250 [Bacteroidetes bacterium]|jgi:ribosomal protein L30E|nr:hypothetical protein [Bacteroidota bacterium]
MAPAINVSAEERKLISVAKQRPSVSIVMSFEHVIASKDEMAQRLKITLERVKRELLSTYPENKAMPVILKLQNLIRNIDYNNGKRAIALFVSPQTENIFYLDTPVDDHLVIDNGFSIHDLVYSRKKYIEFLILLLSASSSKMFLGNSFKVTPIEFKVDKAVAYVNDIAEPVANFSDPDQRKEDLLNKFLQHVDQGLSIALKNYPYPVFVAGADRTLGHFKKITKNEKSLVQFIPGNYIDATDVEMAEMIQPYVLNWINVKQHNILNELKNADDDGKLIFGLKDVWVLVNDKNARLLVVEKSYRQMLSSNIQRPFYVKDAVDKIIEKVLQHGGDIEFVDDGLLKQYKHIALLPFY